MSTTLSTGRSRVWIENGEIAYPVSEVTIAANSRDMVKNIENIGNDPEFHGAIAAPSIRIREMSISGR